VKIFISYRRSDSSESAGRLFDRLVEAFGRDAVFKDVDSIPLQTRFSDFIKTWLEQATLVVVVIGPDWLNITGADGQRRLDDPEDLVRLEILTALSLGIPLIPVLVRNASMPAAAQLPECLLPLTRWNGHLARPDPDFHSDVDKLIGNIQSFSMGNVTDTLARSVGGGQEDRIKVGLANRSRFSRGRLITAGVVVFLLCIAIITADEIRAVITKVDSDKDTITYELAPVKKGDDVLKDEITVKVDPKATLVKGMFDKDTKKLVDGDPIENGLGSNVFNKNDDKKGPRATITTSGTGADTVATKIVVGGVGRMMKKQ
jgi:hypothetical protein